MKNTYTNHPLFVPDNPALVIPTLADSENHRRTQARLDWRNRCGHGVCVKTITHLLPVETEKLCNLLHASVWSVVTTRDGSKHETLRLKFDNNPTIFEFAHRASPDWNITALETFLKGVSFGKSISLPAEPVVVLS